MYINRIIWECTHFFHGANSIKKQPLKLKDSRVTGGREGVKKKKRFAWREGKKGGEGVRRSGRGRILSWGRGDLNKRGEPCSSFGGGKERRERCSISERSAERA